MRERIIGIDFSANAKKAGSLTRIATGTLRGNRTQIDGCFPIPGPSTREAAHGALVRYIAEQADAVIGIDFPFALPAQVMGATRWPEFIMGFGAAHADPDAFRGACMRRARGKELKRDIDVTARAPYSGYNIRMKTMAFHAIRDVLAPLVKHDLARALPMQRPASGKPIIVEICPASTLNRLGLYRKHRGYKSADPAPRRRILTELVEGGMLAPLPKPIEREAIEDRGGDALDAVIAACAVAEAVRTGALEAPVSDRERLEGRIYF